jgi:predicted permease
VVGVAALLAGVAVAVAVVAGLGRRRAAAVHARRQRLAVACAGGFNAGFGGIRISLRVGGSRGGRRQG